MTSFRYRSKDVRPGDLVQYRPLGMPRTEQNAHLFVAFGTVIEVNVTGDGMSIAADWDTRGVSRVVDVNNVEVRARGPRHSSRGRLGRRLF